MSLSHPQPNFTEPAELAARAPHALRKGWCPGALRPMQTGDGLLVRVRPRAGLFDVSALQTVARVAAQFGSGEIDLTNRCNLQLRGLSEATYGEALSALYDAGLIDGSAAAEQVRNIIVDPLAGIDPERADVRDLASEIENIFTQDSAFHALPGKFGVSVSGTPHAIRGQSPADIMVAVAAPGFCSIELDGGAGRVAPVPRAQTPEAVVNLARAFLEFSARSPARRMRDAVAAAGSDAIFAMAGLECASNSARTERDLPPYPGIIGLTSAPFAVSIGLPFGRITAAQLAKLSDAAAAMGARNVRPSQSRTLVIPVKELAAAEALLTLANDIGLIAHGADVRLTMDVCPGAPACANGTTRTRSDALPVAEALTRLGASAPSVHISGCAKGCARRTPAALTFVARDGRYDLIAGDTASGTPMQSDIAPADLASAMAATITGRTP